MPDSVYTVVEVVGTSNESISKAISRAISKAGETLRHLGWFEVVQIRGSIENDQIRQNHRPSRFHLRVRLESQAKRASRRVSSMTEAA